MKTNSAKTPETGPKYWRSLDELAGTPEFNNWLHREFPVGASESDGQSRREFVKVMGASFLLGGLMTGCRRPVETIEPFAKLPEGYVHGGSQFYATSMPTRSGAIPLVVRATDGRPVKIEGNDRYPNWSGSSLHAQASILDLYDPDRSTTFRHNGAAATKEDAIRRLGAISQQFAGNGGQGLAILADRSHSPSRTRLQQAIAQKFPQAKWHVFEATEAPSLAPDLRPVYHFEKAERILSLDCDFLGDEDESARHLRGYAKGRKVRNPGDPMNRLYVVEALMTLTGGAADHRLRKAASEIPAVAQQLAEAIVNGGASQDKWIAECAKDLLAHKGKALVVAGYRQPLAVHQLAMAMNAALGAGGSTVTFLPKPKVQEGTIQELVEALNGGGVQTLVVLGGNPVYNAPADLNFADAIKKAKEVVRLGYHPDETSALSTWHLAEAHYLESWGDTLTTDGILCAVQPLIAPLFGGLSQIEVLARLAGSPQTSGYDIARETFRTIAGDNNVEAAWKDFLHEGFLPKAIVPAQNATLNAGQLMQNARQAAKAAGSGLEVVIYRCGKLGDGRHANNGWLQELPDTVSKLSWDNAVFMSRKTATDLGIEFDTLKNQKEGKTLQELDQRETGEQHVPLVTISVAGKSVTGPAWIQPGMADNTVAVAFGYGRSAIGRIGKGVGFNVNPLRTSASPWLAQGAKVTVAGGTYRLALTQEHWAMEGRPIVREANYEHFQKTPAFAKALNLEEPPGGMQSLYKNPFEDAAKHALHQWGMSIDMNACVGCNACVIACQSENNVPIVGKRQVANGREMHWLRIDRYFTGTVEDPQMATQPMLCQHCEAAPCENVCPVNATAHDHEGLNVMAYNRCVGTRYCSNNCPYKVRRFNYFDYNKRDLTRLYETPMNPFNKRPDGSSEILSWFKSPESGNLPSDEWELMKLVKNPDVSVRMRGVMEKCTYCTQRIEAAKIAQKVKARASGDVVVPDGTFTTACAQACPADAIVFGNIADANSRVSKEQNQPRTYRVLEFLHTRPRTTYAARVRNPNTGMPDYQEYPHSLKEYSDYMGDPFKGHGSHGGEHGDAPHGGPKNSESMTEKKGAH